MIAINIYVVLCSYKMGNSLSKYCEWQLILLHGQMPLLTIRIVLISYNKYL